MNLVAMEFASARCDERGVLVLRRGQEFFIEATGEKPRLWGTSIVGFGEVFCPGSGGKVSQTPLLGFAPRKCAISVYLVDGVDERLV